MIRVDLHEEPSDFDINIRHKGIAWCKEHNINLSQPLPAGIELKPYWRVCLPYMRDVYHFCAYTNILVNPKSGSIDHYHPKSKCPGLAYEWTNYRFALSSINSSKGAYTDVLDPCEIQEGWFHLNIVTGNVYPAEKLSKLVKVRIKKTIDRLKLNDSLYANYRKKYIDDYIKGDISVMVLKRDAPFIHDELKRQGLLRT